MNKIRASFLSLLFLAGCSLSGLTAVNYNNQIVEEMSELSVAIDESSIAYNKALPSPITEQVDIDTAKMDRSQIQIETAQDGLRKLLELESKNEEQQLQVRAKLNAYLDSAELYNSHYENMLNYYRSKHYQNDLTKVKFHDNTLHEAYNSFVHANNELAETLERYVD